MNTINVVGMTCQHCVRNLKTTLESFPEIQQASPDLATGEVSIEGSYDLEEVRKAIREIGYDNQTSVFTV